jgi:hypothetical protein
VLAGARATLQAHQPVVYAEVHDREKLQRSAALLKPLGYGLTLHHTRFYRPTNPQSETAQIFKATAGGSALIALPPGRSLPEGLPGEVRPLS